MTAIVAVTEEQMRAAALHVADQARRLGATPEELQEVLGAIGFYENPLRSTLAPAEWAAGTRSPRVLLQRVGSQRDTQEGHPEMCRSLDPSDIHEMTDANTGRAPNGRRYCRACNLRELARDRESA